MTPLAQSVRERVERLGWAGVIGVALLAFSLSFFASALLPASERLEALRSEVQLAAKHADKHSAPPAPARPGTAEQLATFYAFFPASSGSPALLGQIDAAAQAAQLQLDAGEYKIERPPNAKLARYRITLPVQGSYEQLRRFIGEVLERVPSAVLDEVTLKRDSVESPRLEARIRLTVYMRST